GREVINPRPTQQATIFHLYEKFAIGFLTYSEGVNDDVNKFVWSGLGWNPDMPVIETLRDFGRYFIGERYADGFAQGLLALERNWVGPLATNGGVNTTLEQFQRMERSASPQVSVPLYKAESPERGANLDMIDMPLNNRGWMLARFAEIRKTSDERERLKALDEIVNWTNPGPGGFYDDLGNLTRQPHLVRGP